MWFQNRRKKERRERGGFMPHRLWFEKNKEKKQMPALPPLPACPPLPPFVNTMLPLEPLPPVPPLQLPPLPPFPNPLPDPFLAAFFMARFQAAARLNTLQGNALCNMFPGGVMTPGLLRPLPPPASTAGPLPPPASADTQWE